jgi:hypothetical protein
MVYIPAPKTYKLDFEGTDYDGLEVRMRGLNTGQYMDLLGMKSVADEDADAQLRMLTLMADRLVDWNVGAPDGTPVLTDLDGIRTQDLDLNLAIINAWQKAIAGVPAPLEPGSTGGGLSLMASIPTEPLSQNPESLPA